MTTDDKKQSKRKLNRVECCQILMKQANIVSSRRLGSEARDVIVTDGRDGTDGPTDGLYSV